MKAIWSVPEPDGGRVELREVQIPVIAPGKVLVKVHAAGVNRGELLALRALREGPGAAGGIEFAGEVMAVAGDVGDFQVGDAVMGHGRGGQAQYVLSEPGRLMAKPANLDWIQAAAFPNVYVTAHDALVTNARLGVGEAVLVNAASSGIGIAAIQIARWVGAGLIIGTSRSAEKLGRLRDLGCTHTVCTESDDWPQQVMDITKQAGVDVVVDCLGGPLLDDNLRCMALDARLVSVGRMAGKMGTLDLDWLSLRRLQIIGVTFRTRSPEQTTACVQAAAHDLLGPLAAGELLPVVDKTFALEDIADAHAYMASNAQVGKIVLTVK